MAKMGTHNVEMELTDLEWEIINIALSSPILNYLHARLTTGEMNFSHDEIGNALDSVTEKFTETW